MTIIVYRDGTLASDSLVVAGDFKHYNTEKIIKSEDGVLAGAAGDTTYCQEFLEWACSEKRDNIKPPKHHHLGDCGLLIFPNQKKRLYYGTRYDIVKDKYIAIGVGAEVATGALYMGATAKQAVEAAIAHIGCCGGEIQEIYHGKENSDSDDG